MTTPRIRSLVSLAVALSVTLGACAGAPGRTIAERPAPADARPLALRFNNEAGDHVHVYLVGPRSQWLLGRVEAGARASLRIPDAALGEDQRWMRLAVLAGERVTMRAADDPRAALTMVQPVAEMLAQRWTYSPRLATGQLTALPVGRARDGRPAVTVAERLPR